jgi:hypothetical protein
MLCEPRQCWSFISTIDLSFRPQRETCFCVIPFLDHECGRRLGLLHQPNAPIDFNALKYIRGWMLGW